MTEKWKSNPMHWCDYCKVWMQDTPTAKSTHERGMKHKENVARSKHLSLTNLLNYEGQNLTVASFMHLVAYYTMAVSV